MSIIKNGIAYQILDSRGNPTIEVNIELNNGNIGIASVPSGASTGSAEAFELRDNQKAFNGKGVLKAIENAKKIINKIKNIELNQESLDHKMIEMDGTKNKSKLGANTILGISMAFADAISKEKNIEFFEYIKILGEKFDYRMPMPLVNIINGGVHGNNSLSIQEFMIVPNGAKNMEHAIQISAEIFQILGQILQKKGLSIAVGYEGGYASELHNTYEALDMIIEAIVQSGYKIKEDVSIALDIAANELKTENGYKMDNKILNTEQMLKFYEDLCQKYPIISIEDPFHETDINGFSELTKLIGHKVQIVGDDLFVTNKNIIQQYITKKPANCILIKPNQIGTLTETLETIGYAYQNNMKVIISHRSGETLDTKIADIAVGVGSGQIKTGSVSRGERIAKYNRLLAIYRTHSFKF